MTVRGGDSVGWLQDARCSSHSLGYVTKSEPHTGSDMWMPVDPTQFVGHTHSPALHSAPHRHSTPLQSSRK